MYTQCVTKQNTQHLGLKQTNVNKTSANKTTIKKQTEQEIR